MTTKINDFLTTVTNILVEEDEMENDQSNIRNILDNSDMSAVEKFITAFNNVPGISAKITIEIPELNYTISEEM